MRPLLKKSLVAVLTIISVFLILQNKNIFADVRNTVIAGDETILSIDDFSNLDNSTRLALFQLLGCNAKMPDEEEGNLDFSSIKLEGREIDIIAIDIYFASEEEYRPLKQNKNQEKEFISRMADVFHLDDDCISIMPDAREDKTVITFKFKDEAKLSVYEIGRSYFKLENLPRKSK